MDTLLDACDVPSLKGMINEIATDPIKFSIRERSVALEFVLQVLQCKKGHVCFVDMSDDTRNEIVTAALQVLSNFRFEIETLIKIRKLYGADITELLSYESCVTDQQAQFNLLYKN